MPREERRAGRARHELVELLWRAVPPPLGRGGARLAVDEHRSEPPRELLLVVGSLGGGRLPAIHLHCLGGRFPTDGGGARLLRRRDASGRRAHRRGPQRRRARAVRLHRLRSVPASARPPPARRRRRHVHLWSRRGRPLSVQHPRVAREPPVADRVAVKADGRRADNHLKGRCRR